MSLSQSIQPADILELAHTVKESMMTFQVHMQLPLEVTDMLLFLNGFIEVILQLRKIHLQKGHLQIPKATLLALTPSP